MPTTVNLQKQLLMFLASESKPLKTMICHFQKEAKIMNFLLMTVNLQKMKIGHKKDGVTIKKENCRL